MLAHLLLCAGVLLAGPAFAEPSPEGLFIASCSACHQRNGRGIPQAFPALAGDGLVQGDPQNLVRLLLNGRGGMPAFKAQLNDDETAAVATYVRGAWGNHADPVSAALVAQARSDASANADASEAERNLQAH